MVISSLQGITGPAQHIKAGASGYENLVVLMEFIEYTLQKIPPRLEFVDFIETPHIGYREFPFQDGLAVRGDVPVEIRGLIRQQGKGQGSLPDLSGATDENHLVLQIFADLII